MWASGICNRHQDTIMSITGGRTNLKALLTLCWPRGCWGGPRAVPRGARLPGCSGGRGCFTWGGVVLEGGIDQWEVQQDRGIRAGGVREDVALLRLPLVLRAGLHAGEWQPSASAVHLSLLQRLVGERAPERTATSWSPQLSALENAGMAPAQTDCSVSTQPGSCSWPRSAQRVAKDASGLQR